MYQNEDSM